MTLQSNNTHEGLKQGILIANGDKRNSHAMSDGFRQLGFSVWQANDGPEAVALYEQHAKSIHLTLLDVRLPLLNGPQTLTGLQQLNPQVRCCFMSSDIGNHTVTELINLGAEAVLMKPFSLPYVAQMFLR